PSDRRRSSRAEDSANVGDLAVRGHDVVLGDPADVAEFALGLDSTALGGLVFLGLLASVEAPEARRRLGFVKRLLSLPELVSELFDFLAPEHLVECWGDEGGVDLSGPLPDLTLQVGDFRPALAQDL